MVFLPSKLSCDELDTGRAKQPTNSICRNNEGPDEGDCFWRGVLRISLIPTAVDKIPDEL